MDKQLVKVIWHDAQDHKDKWVDAADAEAFVDTACAVVSIGFLVRKTDKYLTLAGDFDATDDDYGRVTKIPVGCIQSIEDLITVT